MTWFDGLRQKLDEALRKLDAREARARMERQLQPASHKFEGTIYAKRPGAPEDTAASSRAH